MITAISNYPRQNIIERKISEMFGVRYKDASLDGFSPKTESQKVVYNKIKKLTEGIETFIRRGVCLLMLGNIGTGKTTHAAVISKSAMAFAKEVPAVADYMQPKLEVFSVKYVPALHLFRELKSCWQKGASETEIQFIERYSKYDLLIIDEIGKSFGSENEIIHISDIVDRREANLKSTVLISNFATKDRLEEYIGARAIDRIAGSGIILHYNWQSFRTANRFDVLSGSKTGAKK